MSAVPGAASGDIDAIGALWDQFAPTAHDVAGRVAFGTPPEAGASDGFWAALGVMRMLEPAAQRDDVFEKILRKHVSTAVLRAEDRLGEERAVQDLQYVSKGSITEADTRMALALRKGASVTQLTAVTGKRRPATALARWRLRRKLREWIADVELHDLPRPTCEHYLFEVTQGHRPPPTRDAHPAPCDLCLAVVSNRVELLLKFRLAGAPFTPVGSLWNAVRARPGVAATALALVTVSELAVALR